VQIDDVIAWGHKLAVNEVGQAMTQQRLWISRKHPVQVITVLRRVHLLGVVGHGIDDRRSNDRSPQVRGLEVFAEQTPDHLDSGQLRTMNG